MNFELNIKNVGKLADAKIRIGQFTVFAGPNNTGKSTVSKLLYSLFNSINANYVSEYVNSITQPIKHGLSRVIKILDKDVDETLPLLLQLLKEIEELEVLCDEFSIEDNVAMLDGTDSEFVNRVNSVWISIQDVWVNLESMLEDDQEDDQEDGQNDTRKSMLIRNTLISMERYDNMFVDMDMDINLIQLIVGGIEYKFKKNLIQNFQTDIAYLKGKEDQLSEVEITNFGKFTIEDEKIGCKIKDTFLLEFQQYSNVTYLESPVYWKLKDALEDIRISPRRGYDFMEKLNGVPGYFYDLASELKSKYVGEVHFSELYEKLTSAEVMAGKIIVSETGELQFQENGHSFPLQLTAMGVANLGMLALLIERKILNKKSLIFIDEPEAHLHPAWQVVMAETLFELAKGGVNVVIATHSTDILKWLEVHVKKNPDDEKLIALNKFTANGVDSSDGDFKDKIAAIKQELTKPFADLYTAGL